MNMDFARLNGWFSLLAQDRVGRAVWVRCPFKVEVRVKVNGKDETRLIGIDNVLWYRNVLVEGSWKALPAPAAGFIIAENIQVDLAPLSPRDSVLECLPLDARELDRVRSLVEVHKNLSGEFSRKFGPIFQRLDTENKKALTYDQV
jgi:hypothetical protein